MTAVDTEISFAVAQLGKPYSETVDGGVGPNDWDCSGLFMKAAAAGGAVIPRTTQEQWAALEHIKTPVRGCGVYFTVPADGGAPPQHVGIYLGPNLMIEAPHSGDVVKYSTIPNVPGESILGYAIAPFPAPAPPPPTSPLEEILAMIQSDPSFAVRFLYRFCLHREADEAGAAFWVAQLNAGMSLDSVMGQIQDSTEGQTAIAGERKALGLSNG